MFNGIIFSFFKIFYIKYFMIHNFFFLKVNKKFLDLSVGDSLSINGICLTLLYNTLFFFEFDFSYGTFINISNINIYFLNFEKSFYIFNNISGYFLYGHINNLFFLKNKFIYYNIFKIIIFCYINLKKVFIYKSVISLNGISLTLNEIFFFENYLILTINILNYSYFSTNLKFLKILDFLNIELDIFLFFILKFLF